MGVESDWDAARYHRISAPQFDWGQRVIARLKPDDGEWILDLGCGTGRLTNEIRAAITGGRVVGLDVSASMLSVARHAGAGVDARPIAYVQGTAVALPFASAFDAVFSAATLHWIHAHDAVFMSVYRALRPGGRFVAQCGGVGNLKRLLERASVLMASPAYRESFRGWIEPWYFADPETTATRLCAAGFTGVDASREVAPVDLGSAERYGEFVSCVCLRHHLDRLPLALREPFTRELAELAARDSPPFVLDYQRLNITALKADR